MSKQYDYKSLIEAYINLKTYESMPKRKAYYAELVSKLEMLPGITIELPPGTIKEWVWRSQFKIAVEAIVQPAVGGSAGFLEGTPDMLLESIARNEADKKELVRHLIDRRETIGKREHELKVLYENFLYDLIRLWNDDIEKTVTSEDLRAVGFDDSIDKFRLAWHDNVDAMADDYDG